MAPQKLTMTIITMGAIRKASSTSASGAASSHPSTCRFFSRIPSPLCRPVPPGPCLHLANKLSGGPGGGTPPGRSPRVTRGDTDQAAMNSFHLRTMYWFSSITAFQQATAPMRSSKDPPSRTSPAWASTSPVGEVMTSVASLPSNQ